MLLAGLRLVVRRIAHDEHAIPARGDLRAELRQPPHQFGRRFVGQDCRAHRRVLQPRQPLGRGQLQQFLVARPDRERIERGIDAQHDADRAAGDLRGDERALRAGGAHAFHQALPAHRIGRAVGQQEPDRPAGVLAQLRHPGEFLGLDVEVAVHAERAVPQALQRRTDAEQFLHLGIAAGHHLAGRRLVRVGARGGEAERTGLQRLARHAAHRVDVVGGGLLAVDRALAHHVDAQRMVRHLRRDIDRARHAVQRVEVLREAFPVPLQAFRQRDAGDFLHRLHQADQRVVMLAAHRREADAAVAEQDGGDAVP